MEIKKVLTELDIGMSNIEVEGEVTYTETPENRKGISKKTKKPYDFWVQRIFVDDGTGNIECSISVKDENDGITKGVVARVKGKLGEWQDNRNIQGKLIAISKGDRVTDVQQERAEGYFEEKAKIERLADKVKGKGDEIIQEELKPSDARPINHPQINKNNGYQSKDNYWQDKLGWEKHIWKLNRAGMSRSNGVQYAKDMVDIFLKNNVIKPKENEIMKHFWVFAGSFGKYIFNGEKPENGNGNGDGDGKGKKKVGLLHNDREPLEVIDKDAAFPDEVREEIEEAVNKREKEEKAGSSYDNAIPFRGKAKAN